MFYCRSCCFPGNASILQQWPGIIAIISTKVGVEKTSLHALTVKKAVSREENGPHLKDGLASEILIVAIQGLIVCLFLLNYFSFKNVEKESVKSRNFMQLKKKTSLQTPFQYGFLYINILCVFG